MTARRVGRFVYSVFVGGYPERTRVSVDHRNGSPDFVTFEVDGAEEVRDLIYVLQKALRQIEEERSTKGRASQ